MEKTLKAPNYTVEQTSKMTADYVAGITVEAIASALGKTTRSVVAKLSRELKGTANPYKAKSYVAKNGEKPVAKNDLADDIGALLELKENDVDSLTKVTKVALTAILKALTVETI